MVLMENFDEIMQYIEEKVSPKAIDLFESKAGDQFEELLTKVYELHKKNNMRLETAMANIISRK